MKKGRFLWSAHRITEKQKAGKAGNIKEKQLKNSRSTASRQQDVLLSSPRDNYLSGNLIPKILWVFGIFFHAGNSIYWNLYVFFYIQFAEILKNQYFFHLFSDILKKR